MREKYMKLKDLNEHLLKKLETDQQEVDRLTMKKAELEDVSTYLSSSFSCEKWIDVLRWIWSVSTLIVSVAWRLHWI